MNSRKSVLAFVMAGGEGTRLHPLTADRCKPAVPFNGKHRVVDFVLSNLINSEIFSICLLVQYKSQALIEHVRQSWTMARFIPEHFVTVVPPQMCNGTEWFQGTADAVRQNIHLIETNRPDFVAVFGADHIYRMDVRQMLQSHVESQADVSMATLPMPLSQCNAFGIVETDDRLRITGFQEKPPAATPMRGRPGHALASMGNYIFRADVLVKVLRDAAQAGESDFGKHILPRMVRSHRLVAYDFTTNVVPGVAPFEEPAYWRDVGTIESYFDAHFDTLGARPKFRLRNREWPIYASAELAEAAQIEAGEITRSVIGSGSVIEHACLDHALLRQEVRVESDAHLSHSIVMDRSVIGRGARIRRAIIDEDNHIPPGERIGFDLARDRDRFHVSPSGIVIVPRGHFPSPAAPLEASAR